MKVYLASLVVGLLVGVLYNLVNVRSPAPPVVALIGLLGILAGEQVPPLLRMLWARESLTRSWLHQVQPHMFGHLPKGGRPAGLTADLAAEPARTEQANPV